MAKKEFDVIVIGGGPAGYVSAIRAAQLGLEVACVEMWLTDDQKPKLGGTCLNVGCIPSKALLESSEYYFNAKRNFENHGITTGDLSIDIAKMVSNKDKTVDELTSGIAQLFQANGITLISGKGKLFAQNRVEVTDHEGNVTEYYGHDVVLATGSTPINLPMAAIDGERIIDSEGALSLTEVPKRLGVIGGGVIGLEMGTVWSRLGSEVVIFEALDKFLPAADDAISREAARQFRAQGLDIRTGAVVTATESDGKHVKLQYEDANGKYDETFDYLLVAVGRKPVTEDLADDSVDLLMDGDFVHVDEECKTNLPGVWAIGDIVRGPMLAHKGSEEGIAVAERIAGEYARVNYEAIPSVIYTDPEIAWIGKSEECCKQEGIEIKVGQFSFAASGRAKAMNRASGFVKIIAEAESDRLLGMHIIGPQASELIHEAALVLEYEGCAEDIARTMHAHPTLAEAVREAALAVDKRALHMVNRK